MSEEEQKAIEELKKDLNIEIKECSSSNDYKYSSGLYLNGNVETLLNLISKLQSDIEIKDKVINYIAKHTYIRTGENGVLDTITEEVIEHLYKKVEEEK